MFLDSNIEIFRSLDVAYINDDRTIISENILYENITSI